MTFLEKCLKWLLPHKDVNKNGALYLRRHYLSPRTWSWRIFLHLINQRDLDRHPHNHPWPFYGIVLWGGYIEAVFNKGAFVRTQVRGPGAHGYRPETTCHQIVKLLRGRAWTLVLAGPAVQEWGFFDAMDNFTPAPPEDGEEPWVEDVIR